MKALLIGPLVLAALCPKRAYAAESCLADYNDEELHPAVILDEERAITWSEACTTILAKEKEYDAGGKLVTCAGEDADALKFCRDPLKVKVPQYSQLVTARRHADNGACALSTDEQGSQSNVPLLGSGFEDDLIRGLAKFVVARAKAEAMAWTLDELKTHLCSQADAQDLLPTSCALINASGTNAGSRTSWGTLKTAFETDLARLPDRAAHCLLTKAGAPDEVKTLMVSGVQAARLVREGADPIAVLAGLTERFPLSDCGHKQSECALHLLGYTTKLLSRELTSDSGLSRIEDKLRYTRIAAALFVEHAKPELDVVTSVPIETIRADMEKVSESITRLIQKLIDVRNALKRDDGDGPASETVTSFARQLIELMNTAFELVPDSAMTKPTKKQVLDALTSVKILTLAIDAAIERDYARTYVYVVQALRRLNAKLPKWFTQYGPFVAEIAAAKTPEDVERALEAFAAPVGASLAKRGNGRATVALNAFVGVQGGYERVDSKDIDSVGAGQFGLFAPVGVDMSWGFCQSLSIGVFLSVIDLGALASFRGDSKTKDDDDQEVEVETTPEIGFEQIFSPGAYVVLGFDRFAFGVGTSLTPSLRRVTTTDEFSGDETVDEDAAWRIGVFLALDITILPF